MANRWSHPHGKTSSEVVPFTWQPTLFELFGVLAGLSRWRPELLCSRVCG
jgi:hypothetical protein